MKKILKIFYFLLITINVFSQKHISLPLVVTDSYVASNCDELHAFQSTNGKVVGNMNVVVGNMLKKLHKQGLNPIVDYVFVKVDGMRVTWSVLIEESSDGQSWVGFTSRGAGCNNDISDRCDSPKYGNDVNTLIRNIIRVGYNKDTDFDLEIVNIIVYRGDGSEVGNSFKQIFYRYTRPKDYPNNELNN